MSPAIRSNRRRLGGAVLVAISVCCAVVLPRATESAADPPQPGVRYESWIGPQVGPLLGAAPSAGPGEVWAVRTVPREAPPQPFLMRYRRGEGWRVGPAGVDEKGDAFGGGRIREGRVTPGGGIVLFSRDDVRPEGEQRIVVVADPGGTPRVVPAPPAELLLPRKGSTPPETLSEQALAARDSSAETEAFVGIAGHPLQTGILRWHAGEWTREPICVAADAAGTPPEACSPSETLTGSQAALTVVALAAAGGDAWALARAETSAERGLVLFQRVSGSGSPRWALRELGPAGAPLFAASATSARGVSGVAPLDSGAALTATPSGVWLDGSFEFQAVRRGVTIYLGGGAATTWCDGADASGAFCDHPLGIQLDATARSNAWSGPEFGSRVVGTVSVPGSPGGWYATLEGTRFVPRPAFGGTGAAFIAPDEGWLGSVHVTREPWSSPLEPWSVPVRRPLTAVTGAPGGAAGDLGSAALAVGMNGSILRYAPGQGWDSEALISAGGVSTANLRGVAWPTPSFAYAVGDEGAMWRWWRSTELWEPDPGAPFEFVSNLTGIAFQAGNPDRGFAIGRGGTLLRFGKSWEQEPVPPELQTGGPLGGPVDLTSIAFAGSEALVAAGGHLLVEEGGGWRVDAEADELIAQAGSGASIIAVAGLPDGGAVAAGFNFVIERDSAGSPWRVSDEPIGGNVIAAAAFREGGRVRALVSIGSEYPLKQDVLLPVTDPNAPQPRLPGLTLPGRGTLVRETAAGWRPERRDELLSPGADLSEKSDPVLALLADEAGRAWAVGGWNSNADGLGHGVDVTTAPLIPRMETATIERYDPAGPAASPNLHAGTVPMPAGPARFVVGGGARCLGACADLGSLGIAPDRTLGAGLAIAGRLRQQPNGPRAFLYTGGRAAVPGEAEQGRFAELMATSPLPLLPAVADSEALGNGSDSYESAFAGFPAPLGNGPAPLGFTPVGGAPSSPTLARTHYAVDTQGPEGPVRVVVIDNATGSLAARNLNGNPVEDQMAWLQAVLLDARQRGIATIVEGSRPLDPNAPGAATDAEEVARALRDGGASAYLYEGPREQRATLIPSGAGEVPAFASGTLGYRGSSEGLGFDPPGILLLEIEAGKRDPQTNRAPVEARLIPVIEDLALEAIDGRVLERSRPALFRGLGRRPRSGDSYEDQYVALPTEPCRQACPSPNGSRPSRIDAEVSFTSSDPDIADFVKPDLTSANPRKPYVNPKTDKPVHDGTSGLLCPYNAGTTTVTIASGGLSYSTKLTVQGGSVLRPCGTVPLKPSRFPQPAAPTLPAPAPSPAPPTSTNPTPTIPPPPPPPPAAQPLPLPSPPVPPSPFVPLNAAALPLPLFVPLLAVSAARPIPPSGTSPVSSTTSVTQPATKVEEEEEDEVATEQQQSAVVYRGEGDDMLTPSVLLVLALAGALSISGLHQSQRRRRDGGPRPSFATVRSRRF